MSRGLGLIPLAAAAAVALAVVLPSGDSRGATGPVAVYPTESTPVASPTTQISFRGASLGDLGTVSVDGSKTGHHPGKLVEHSDRDGASFFPARPFAPGETVTVRAGLPLVGAVDGAVTFSILQPPLRRGKPQLIPDPGGHPRALRFHSRKDIEPPSLGVLRRSRAAAPGSIFLGVKAGPGANGPAIYDSNGGLVWFNQMRGHQSAFDFRVQRYQGKPVLTWWQGEAIFPGEGLGAGMIYDTSYRRVKVVKAGNGYEADLHEFQLTPQGTALLMAYRPVLYDLTPAHGPRNGLAIDNVLQEIDVKTGLVEREWHSLGHVPVSDAAVRLRPKVPFDAFHANSIEQEADGNWLVSSRNTSAAYEIDTTTGNILWILGGKRSSFRMDQRARSLGQHDVRRTPDGNITMFDNGTAGTSVGRPSRALELKLDMTNMTATTVRAFEHRHPTERTFSQGSVQTLPNGDLFVGWGGANSYVTEFSRTGQVVFDAIIHPSGDDTYRAFRFPWSGAIPAEGPRAVAAAGRRATSVWASWNGATEVATWQVLAGERGGSLKSAGRARFAGFETRIRIHGSPRLVQVRALDRSGKVLAGTRVLHVRG